MKPPPIPAANKALRWPTACTIHRANFWVMVGLAACFFLLPGALYVYHLQDPNLAGPGIPKLGWTLFRSLTPRYEKWARERVASGAAARVNTHDVAGTEWPMFGSVFYLWAVESLQTAWESDPSLAPIAPREYARGAVEACQALILDPNHHAWVREKWGDHYMNRENLFFRSLIIAGTLSHAKLTGSGGNLALLRRQATSLAQELDDSPHGLIHDYPGECYPLDVLAAIAFIKEAYLFLGLDPDPFVQRSRRAFEGERLDALGLIPFMANPRTGVPSQVSRGTVHSWAAVFTGSLYPDLHARWYDVYEKQLWQEGLCAGYREFLKETPGGDFLFDIDAGPILAGYNPAANAFGYAAARVNGRLDQARVLGAQVLAVSWPLPDGGLLGPRILSISPHAPHLGEAAVLFLLTRTPSPGIECRRGGEWPAFVWIMMLFYFGMGAGLIARAWSHLRRLRGVQAPVRVPLAKTQTALWMLLLVAAAVFLASGRSAPGVLALFFAYLLPRHASRGPASLRE
jgi:hypothetical protein